MRQSPCYKCQDRYVGCHAKCERYIEWSAAREAERERIHKIKENDKRYADYKIKAIARIRRK